MEDPETPELIKIADEQILNGNIQEAAKLYQTILVLEETASKLRKEEIGNSNNLSSIINCDTSGVITALASSGLLNSAIKLRDWVKIYILLLLQSSHIVCHTLSNVIIIFPPFL